MSEISLIAGRFSPDKPNGNGRIYPPNAIADNQYVAWQACIALQNTGDYRERLAIFRDKVSYNKSKFARMSKRRKKIFTAKPCGYYNIHTGLLVHCNRRREQGVKELPLYMYVEQTSEAETDFFDAWVKECLH